VTKHPRVEVHRVRGGLELRIDGTQASVHRPGRALTGPVWWALASPVLLLPRDRPRRVLLLGLAAGSVARALRALDAEAEIVGVELNPEVLRLARRHFELDRLDVELVVGDAIEYLRRERRRFDLIVEDLFVGTARSVRKPEWVTGEGYRLVGRRLRKGGYVVSNTIHETADVARAMRPLGRRIVSLDVAGHWNRILVCGPGLRPRDLRRRLGAGHLELARRLGRGSLAVRTVYTPPQGGREPRD
jgi:spermidine synthase